MVLVVVLAYVWLPRPPRRLWGRGFRIQGLRLELWVGGSRSRRVPRIIRIARPWRWS